MEQRIVKIIKRERKWINKLKLETGRIEQVKKDRSIIETKTKTRSIKGKRKRKRKERDG